MKKTGLLRGVAAALGMLVLILDSQTALEGARDGLDLCVRTVIPSLFPFFVISILLTGTLTGKDLPLLRPLGRLTGIPAGAESILLAGFLGGYPVGAQSIAAAHSKGQLSQFDATRMLAFCNNAGPAFLFGMAGSLFPYGWMAWALWGIHIVSALIVSLALPGRSQEVIHPTAGKSIDLPAAMASAVRVMASVCGWVVLFRVILAFLNRWVLWLLPSVVQIILSGILELSNGCCSLIAVQNIGLRFVICSGILAFGGLCVTMQTVSVAQGTDLRLYFPGKLMQTALSLLLALSVQGLLPDEMRIELPGFLLPLLAVTTLFFFLLFAKKQKRSSIPVNLGV